jgi:FkbM family methyltransferase
MERRRVLGFVALMMVVGLSIWGSRSRPMRGFTTPQGAFQITATKCTSAESNAQVADFVGLRDYLGRNGLYLGLLSEIGLLPSMWAVWPITKPVVYVDVGANVGQSSAMVLGLWGRPTIEFLELGQSKWEFEFTDPPRVFALDVSPGNIDALNRLKSKLPPALQQNFVVLNHGLSDVDETICVTGTKAAGGQSSSVSKNTKCSRDQYEARVVSFMNFLAENKLEYASMVKIDTEGHDPVIVRDMYPLLRQHKIDTVLFEYHGIGAWTQTTLQKIVHELNQLGYDSFMMGDFVLYKLNGCWREEYEFKFWSNVFVMRRGLEHAPDLVREYSKRSCRDVPTKPRPDAKICKRLVNF